jgi:energy-coupling factor transporter ATP-binding protein EcfA2
MKDFVESLLNNYTRVKAEGFANHPFAVYMRNEVPRLILKTGIVESDRYLIEGSVGKGNWATVPWVCIFDRKITTSATSGVYIVYLLSEDGETLYLTLNQGCTRIREKNSKRETIKILNSTASAIRSRVNGMGFNDDNDFRLNNKPNELAELYQAGTIFYRAYRKNNIPAEEVLRDDLQKMIEIYKEYISQLDQKTESLLITWNPSNWDWNDYDNAISVTQAKGDYELEWSCAKRSTQDGQRVFLLLIGTKDQNGIIASGYAVGESFSALHWDPKRADAGEYINKIKVRFDKILDYREDHYIYQSVLEERFPNQHWSSQSSGITIRSEYTDALENLWKSINKKEVSTLTEKETLKAINEYIKFKGFTYEDGLIENFFLSIKSKPFVLLAGTSGTGKTKLIRLFAEAVGATTENGHFKMIPVRPDWSDSSDLFGHVNINGKFIPGAVIDFLKQAIETPKYPHFLCFDEMNLARVEYYFSDFLSIIETRALQGETITSDPLIDANIFGSDKSAHEYYGMIPFPQNLYIVGTVNMDETTFPFSKKVLDRANTIEFSYVDLRFQNTEGEYQSTYPNQLNLENSFFRSEFLTLLDCKDASKIKSYSNKLFEINEILKKTNSHFGYRVRDEVVFYLLYNDQMSLLTEDQAMDNAIMQKILPRINGSSLSIKITLCQVFEYLGLDLGTDDFNEPDISEKMINALQNQSTKYPLSTQKIMYMVRRYEEDGFTTYWL